MIYQPEYSPSTSEIIATTAQLITALVAYAALNTWQKKMKGEGKYNAAKNLLIGTKKVEAKIQDTVRNPFISPKEIGLEDPDKNYQYLVYQKRLRDMYDFKAEVFDGYVFEAEAILEQSIKEKIRDFNQQINKLRGAIYIAYGMFTGEPEYDKKIWEQRKEKIHKNQDLLFNTQLEDDIYSKELMGCVVAIEDELKKYIGDEF